MFTTKNLILYIAIASLLSGLIGYFFGSSFVYSQSSLTQKSDILNCDDSTSGNEKTTNIPEEIKALFSDSNYNGTLTSISGLIITVENEKGIKSQFDVSSAEMVSVVTKDINEYTKEINEYLKLDGSMDNIPRHKTENEIYIEDLAIGDKLDIFFNQAIINSKIIPAQKIEKIIQ